MASQSVSFQFSTLLLIFLISFSEGREFWLEGHHNTWKIPSSPDGLTKWASILRFEIGDAIVVDYDPKSDSILEVTKENFNKCNKSNPIKKYEDGNTTITLNISGWFYFISGVDENCNKGQKLAVDVLSAKHSIHHHLPSSSPSVSPAYSYSNGHAPAGAPSFDSLAPAPAPSSGAHDLKITTKFASSIFMLASVFGLIMM